MENLSLASQSQRNPKLALTSHKRTLMTTTIYTKIHHPHNNRQRPRNRDSSYPVHLQVLNLRDMFPDSKNRLRKAIAIHRLTNLTSNAETLTLRQKTSTVELDSMSSSGTQLNLFHQHLEHVGKTPDKGAYLTTLMVMCRPPRHGADRNKRFAEIDAKKQQRVRILQWKLMRKET